ncbi:RDD family protein [Cellulomonas composti]|uniref:RDD family protein n=1 Tax=Cellulomonas composti TaxID=266130 RepID=A0A511JAY3_9CELL|nr:RDD family protein [Cellulomonas composti]GEL95146.1 RDD family protein [Cellulomonas composti]
MDQVVIGEGVALDIRAASAASRLLGALVDLALLAVVIVVGAILLNQTVGWSDDLGQISAVVFLATIMIVLPTAVDTLTRGRSLGKVSAGIRIVRDDGGPIVFRQAFVRALTGVVELWLTFGVIALVCSMVHPQGKRVGDILAGTYAVRVRGASTVRRPVLMPPQLRVWAAAADVARMPDGLALAVRQFLARAATMHGPSRVELGTQLTREVQRYVQPLPPAGTHPEAFLAAVLAERREREIRAGARTVVRQRQEVALLSRLPHGVPDPES